MKKTPKKIIDTQTEMLESRIEDTVRLRKKAENLIKSSNEDIAFLNKSKEELLQKLNDINVRLSKTNGALSILKILLEDKTND